MAPVPEKMIPSIEDAFIADRVTFWSQFTNATKYAIYAIIALLLVIYVAFG